ncbi:MAG: hypothetical protein JXR10_03005 [Cyclobacteriaceae bacterium]
MEIKNLDNRINIDQDKRLAKAYSQLNLLLMELNKNDLPQEIIISINSQVDAINSYKELDKGLKKLVRKTQSRITTQLEKELKLVTKNHYRNSWLIIGMSVFGVPFGGVFAAIFENMGFFGLGLPIGMAVGLAIGSGLDVKAFEAGRQLDIELIP